jgi:nucleoside-diphosphate-sugar epimerase
MVTDVLVTGGAGTVGTALRTELGDDPDYAFTWLDVTVPDDPGAGEEWVVADARDAEALSPHVEAADAVIHLALNPDISWTVTDVRWSPALVDNLRSTVAVHDAVVEAGVDSLVFASTNHVVGRYEQELAPEIYGRDYDLCVDHTEYRPDSTYGVVKAFGEQLSRLCGEVHGVRTYCLRLGMVRPPDGDHPHAAAELTAAAGDCERGDEEYRRLVGHGEAMWLSNRDLAGLVDCCLRDEDVTRGVFNAVSENATRWLDIEHARETVGYDPRDDGTTHDPPA